MQFLPSWHVNTSTSKRTFSTLGLSTTKLSSSKEAYSSVKESIWYLLSAGCHRFHKIINDWLVGLDFLDPTTPFKICLLRRPYVYVAFIVGPTVQNAELLTGSVLFIMSTSVKWWWVNSGYSVAYMRCSSERQCPQRRTVPRRIHQPRLLCAPWYLQCLLPPQIEPSQATIRISEFTRKTITNDVT